MLIIFLMLMPIWSYANVDPTLFERTVESKNIKASCVGDVNDHLIFSMGFKEFNISHKFLIMRGLDYETCIDLRTRVKRVLKQNEKILLAGYSGSKGNKANELIYEWRFVKGKNSCVSYSINFCQ